MYLFQALLNSKFYMKKSCFIFRLGLGLDREHFLKIIPIDPTLYKLHYKNFK